MFTFTNKEVGSLLTDEKCFNDLYDLYKYKYFKNKLVLVIEDQIVYELPLKMISVKWAVACAEKCLHIFEKARPNDNRPKKAIEAAKQWIIDQTNTTAADDVYTAAVYVDDAANAAYSAAYAASRASHASTSAYYAAVAVANSSDINTAEQKWSRNKLKEIVGEYIIDYKNDLKNTLIIHIIPELSDIIINYVV